MSAPPLQTDITADVPETMLTYRKKIARSALGRKENRDGGGACGNGALANQSANTTQEPGQSTFVGKVGRFR